MAASNRRTVGSRHVLFCRRAARAGEFASAAVVVCVGLLAAPGTVFAQASSATLSRATTVASRTTAQVFVPAGRALHGSSAGAVSPGAAVPGVRASSDGWEIVRSANPKGSTGSFLEGVACPSSSDCEAVGNYINSSRQPVTLAERWNGAKWAVQSTPDPAGSTSSFLDALACPSSSDCEAVGIYTDNSGLVLTLAESWNGTDWTVQTTPNPTGATSSYLQGVACPSSTDCEAVGNYTNSSNVTVTLAEEWNGTSWTVQTTPNPTGATYGFLSGVACASATDCDAVGSYNNNSGLTMILAERWNGASWTVQTTPNPSGYSYLEGVACPSSGDCEAVGGYYNTSGVRVTLAEGWNGTSWTVQTTPKPAGSHGRELNGVACRSSSDCHAVGDYTNASHVQVTLAERWKLS